MRNWSMALVLLAMVLAPVGAAHAEDIALKKIMRNAMYGGAVGALIGTAILAFSDNRSDNLDFILNGAAGGILVGVVWGAYDSSSAYVSLEDGKFHAALPTPSLQLARPSRADTGQREVILSTRLLGVRF